MPGSGPGQTTGRVVSGLADGLEARIEELYSVPLDAFIPARDAMVKDLKAAGDADAAKRVKAARKPVVPAWAVNRLVRDDPGAIDELLALGERLRAEQRRAISGGDVDALREALDERRRIVRALTRAAMAILRSAATGTAAHEEEITATLEAAAADEESGDAVRAGRLEKPLRPPSGFADAGGLRVLEGGRSKRAPTRTPEASAQPRRASTSDREAAAERRAREKADREARTRLEREVTRTEKLERAAAKAVEAAKARIERIDRERGEAKDALRAAESELRGATLERKRAAAALDGARRSRG